MVGDFIKYIDNNHLFNRNGKILLAVSGGIDSMVMADLFLKAGLNTAIAHCNFCLRPGDADLDEEMVREFALQNKIIFHCKRFETKRFASENGISVQMAARELRYTWFETIRSENNYDCVAVAHNLNDNIETLLINLTRGTGISGLTGMRPVSNRIVRPLLFADRRRIEMYAREYNVPYREDKSNAETKYTRNKIRHLVVPVLKEINPSIEETLNDTAQRLAGINEIAATYIGNLRKNISTENEGVIIFTIKEIRSHQANPTVLFELFRPFGLTGNLIKDFINVLNGKTGGQLLTRTHRILKNREELIIEPHETLPGISYGINKISDFQELPGIVSADILNKTADFRIPRDQCIACIDYDLLKFPLMIRKWKKGDFFFPFGMKNKRKLSDYFIDRKYPVTKKEKALILESNGMIVWIICERLDNRFRITESTSKILRIEAFIR